MKTWYSACIWEKKIVRVIRSRRTLFHACWWHCATGFSYSNGVEKKSKCKNVMSGKFIVDSTWRVQDISCISWHIAHSVVICDTHVTTRCIRVWISSKCDALDRKCSIPNGASSRTPLTIDALPYRAAHTCTLSRRNAVLIKLGTHYYRVLFY